ncbi:MAG: hypothetical protein IIU75_07115, partial [Rikenellaceae bacterium]|nr:hypothetical protein [Rikenellaceae bacterium]
MAGYFQGRFFCADKGTRTSPSNPDNLRLQQPPVGLLSTAAAVRVRIIDIYFQRCSRFTSLSIDIRKQN